MARPLLLLLCAPLLLVLAVLACTGATPPGGPVSLDAAITDAEALDSASGTVPCLVACDAGDGG
jgi:hypothetical protein